MRRILSSKSTMDTLSLGRIRFMSLHRGFLGLFQFSAGHGAAAVYDQCQVERQLLFGLAGGAEKLTSKIRVLGPSLETSPASERKFTCRLFITTLPFLVTQLVDKIH